MVDRNSEQISDTFIASPKTTASVTLLSFSDIETTHSIIHEATDYNFNCALQTLTVSFFLPSLPIKPPLISGLGDSMDKTLLDEILFQQEYNEHIHEETGVRYATRLYIEYSQNGLTEIIGEKLLYNWGRREVVSLLNDLDINIIGKNSILSARISHPVEAEEDEITILGSFSGNKNYSLESVQSHLFPKEE